jgi:hypothetical protein
MGCDFLVSFIKMVALEFMMVGMFFLYIQKLNFKDFFIIFFNIILDYFNIKINIILIYFDWKKKITIPDILIACSFALSFNYQSFELSTISCSCSQENKTRDNYQATLV